MHTNTHAPKNMHTHTHPHTHTHTHIQTHTHTHPNTHCTTPSPPPPPPPKSLTMKTQDGGVEGGRCREAELDDVVLGFGQQLLGFLLLLEGRLLAAVLLLFPRQRLLLLRFLHMTAMTQWRNFWLLQKKCQSVRNPTAMTQWGISGVTVCLLVCVSLSGTQRPWLSEGPLVLQCVFWCVSVCQEPNGHDSVRDLWCYSVSSGVCQSVRNPTAVTQWGISGTTVCLLVCVSLSGTQRPWLSEGPLVLQCVFWCVSVCLAPNSHDSVRDLWYYSVSSGVCQSVRNPTAMTQWGTSGVTVCLLVCVSLSGTQRPWLSEGPLVLQCVFWSVQNKCLSVWHPTALTQWGISGTTVCLLVCTEQVVFSLSSTQIPGMGISTDKIFWHQWRTVVDGGGGGGELSQRHLPEENSLVIH